MIKIIDKENIDITCAHCNRKINTAWVCEHFSDLGVRYIYLCSSCQRLLGIAHKKGFSNIEANLKYNSNLKSYNTSF